MLTKHQDNGIQLDTSSYTPVYVQLKEALLEFVQSKEVHIGEKIPSLNQLKERYRASDTTCKKAISELMHEGILEGRQGKGVFIKSKFSVTAVKEVVLIVRHGPEILRHPAFSEMVNGIMHEIGRGNTHLSFSFIDPILMKPEELERRISQIKGAGVIIPLIPGLTSRILNPLLETHIPVVFISERFPEISSYMVKWDAGTTVRKVIGRVLSEGKRKIAFIGSPWDALYTDIKNGIEEAFRNKQLEFSPEWIRRGPYSFEAGRKLTGELLSDGLKPELIIANDDAVAQGVIAYLQEQNMPVPDCIEVLSIGGFSTHLPYELTSIRMPYFEIGEKAAGMILDMIHEKVPKNPEVIVPCSLKQGSTMMSVFNKQERKP